MLRFSFGTAAASAVATAESYGMMDALSDGTIRRIGWTLESSNNCCIRISDAERGTLYLSKSFQSSRDLIGSLEENGRSWMYFFQDGRYYMQSACCVEVGQRQFYLENLRDITATIQKRNRYLMFYQLMTLVLMAFSAVAMLLLSVYLTRPMHKLSVVSRRIAGGDYQLRCTVTSRDEIGALTEDFNAMADSLETKIHQLEDASKRQEDFIASFAHELKTPLTSIIGYSDMLRSQTLLPEQQFKAANYIHSEGKRLESLSHKLLELIVYRRETYTPAAFEAQPWLSAIAAVLEPSFWDSGISLMLSAGPGVIWGEADLLESLVVNLCDNARKASPAGSVVSLIGTAEEGATASVYVTMEAVLRRRNCCASQSRFTWWTSPCPGAKRCGAGLGPVCCSGAGARHSARVHQCAGKRYHGVASVEGGRKMRGVLSFFAGVYRCCGAAGRVAAYGHTAAMGS